MMATYCYPASLDGQQVHAWTRLSVRGLADLPAVLQRVAADVQASGGDAEDSVAVVAALTEAVVNAVRHGHGGDNSKVVRVCYHITRGHWLAEVVDQGRGFCPDRFLARPAAEVDPGRGRGIGRMRRSLSWLRYSRGGTRLTLCKRLGAAARPIA